MRTDARIALGAFVIVLIAFAILAWFGYVNWGEAP